MMESNKKVPFYKDKTIKLITEDDWINNNSVKAKLSSILKRITESEEEVEVMNVPDNVNGDYSTNIAFKNAKKENVSPMIYAENLVDKVLQDKEFNSIFSLSAVESANGFLNIDISEELALQLFHNNNDKYKPLSGKKIMVEFAHPNPFKAFHIGHLRNIILGESIIRLLEKMGAEVVRTNYQGDVGMHIAKCLWAFKQIDEKEYPTDVTKRVQLIAKCYSDGAKAFEDAVKQEEIKEINRLIYTKEDKTINKLWALGKQWSLDKFHEIYKRVDSKFDREYMESETLELCKKYNEKALKKGILEKSEGAIVFKGEKYGLDTRVFMNSQGLPTYEGKELGLAFMEFSDFGDIDLCIHNVAVEQISFFKVTFKVEALLDKKFEGRQYHNAYEFVGLKSGKMSSRTGNVVLGEDIINEAVKKIKEIIKDREGMTDKEKEEVAEIVGVGAIKYSFLNISPGSYLAFDLDKSLSFEGNSGPYIQYTYTRANKVVQDSGASIQKLESKHENLNDAELLLVKKLNLFNDIIVDSAKNLAPNILATYLFELSQIFNNFYKFNSILKANSEEEKTFRILLTARVKDTLEEGLRLMGIKVPQKM